MARCTASVRGHSSAAAAARCPACRYKNLNYGGYNYNQAYNKNTSINGYPSAVRSLKPRWSKSSSSISYTHFQIQSLTPIREAVESKVSKQPDIRDVFLCHAWLDRKESAKQLNDYLEYAGVKVWFSEKDIGLGVPMMRAIDKGLANSKVGLVLVTPAMLDRLQQESVADKELSALLAGNRLVPIVHNTTYDELREVSPLLASRSGLDSSEDSMEVIAEKIAELVNI